jgi:8-oxo-dGTP pyrophosphatase MutT (NUDIX family)
MADQDLRRKNGCFFTESHQKPTYFYRRTRCTGTENDCARDYRNRSPTATRSPATAPAANASKPTAPKAAAYAPPPSWFCSPKPQTVCTLYSHDHAGQISFPGGRKDEGDADLIATALREAHEEIGADAGVIEIVGALPNYVTITAYEVTPIVAVSPPQPFVPEPFEVAGVFSVPLAHFLNEDSWKRDGVLRDGVRREFWTAPYAEPNGTERYIWGATAGMLRALSLHLRSAV